MVAPQEATQAVDRFFSADSLRLHQELEPISGFVSTVARAARVLYDSALVSPSAGPTRFDSLLGQIAAQLEGVIDHLGGELERIIHEDRDRRARCRSVHEAVLDALAARGLIVDWSRLAPVEARARLATYEHAKATCTRALLNLSRDDVAAVTLELYVLVATVQLNLLATGMQVFPEEIAWWRAAVAAGTGYVEKRLPRLSERYIDRFKTRVHAIGERFEREREGDRRVHIAMLYTYRYAGQAVGTYRSYADADAARRRGIALTAPYFINPADRLAEAVRSWRGNQPAWRWCPKCQAIFYGVTSGRCPRHGMRDVAGAASCLPGPHRPAVSGRATTAPGVDQAHGRA